MDEIQGGEKVVAECRICGTDTELVVLPISEERRTGGLRLPCRCLVCNTEQMISLREVVVKRGMGAVPMRPTPPQTPKKLISLMDPANFSANHKDYLILRDFGGVSLPQEIPVTINDVAVGRAINIRHTPQGIIADVEFFKPEEVDSCITVDTDV